MYARTEDDNPKQRVSWGMNLSTFKEHLLRRNGFCSLMFSHRQSRYQVQPG